MKRSVPTSAWLFLLLITAVMLSACERPVPDAGNVDGGVTAPDSAGEPDGGEVDPTTDPATSDPYPADGGEGEEPAPADGGEGEQPADGGEGEEPAPADGGEGEQPADGGEGEEPAPADGGEGEQPADSGEGEEPAPAEETGGNNPDSYTVQAGDTLGAIAERFGVSIDDLVVANNLPSADTLVVGQQLTIPEAGIADSGVDAGGEEETPADEGNGDEAQPGEQVRVVQPGDNLFRIALEFGLTVDELATYNNIADPTRIDVGQIIRIPPSE